MINIPFKLWVFTLLSFENGKVEIIKSFTKPAKDSDARPKRKGPKPKTKIESRKGGEVDLFE